MGPGPEEGLAISGGSRPLPAAGERLLDLIRADGDQGSEAGVREAQQNPGPGAAWEKAERLAGAPPPLCRCRALEARLGSAGGLGRVLGPVSCVSDFSLPGLGEIDSVHRTETAAVFGLGSIVGPELSSCTRRGLRTVRAEVWSLDPPAGIPGLGVGFAAAEAPP